MTYTARWGPKGFLVSPSKIVPIDGISTAFAIKSNNSNSNSSTPTDTRTRDKQKVSLSTVYLRAAGVDPRAQLEEWEALLGQAYPLYIGEKRFGPAKMMLSSVSVSDVMLTNSGEFLKLNLSISLEEYTDDPATTTTRTAAVSGGTASGSGSSASTKAAAAYEQKVAEKKSALAATAPKSDRQRLGKEMTTY